MGTRHGHVIPGHEDKSANRRLMRLGGGGESEGAMRIRRGMGDKQDA